jgi:5-methylcytosine-specific restriction endonuclease McrA
MNIEKGLYYEKEVWANTELDILRRNECLCLNCDRMLSCQVAKKLYEICKTNNMAVAITRCGAMVDGELMFKLKGE